MSSEKVQASLTSLNSILKSYDGFVGRQLAVGNKNQWMDLVFWKSMEHATFAAEDVLNNETAQKAFEVIDESEMNFFHFEPVSQTFNDEQHSTDKI